MYVLIEMQKQNDTTVAIPPIITKTDRNEAESEFHRLCSVAAVSSVPVHTIVMVNEYGDEVRPAEHYIHREDEA